MPSSKEYHRKYYEEHTRKYSEEDIDNIFNDLINSKEFKPYHLTIRGFKEITNINPMIIIKTLKLRWIDVLDKYNISDILYKYVLDEYMKYYLSNYNCGIDYFKSNHKYISQDIIKQFTLKQIKKDCGFLKTTHQHNLVGLQKNFNEVKSLFKRIPTYTEFIENTKINLASYFTYFNTKKYEDVIKYFNTDFEIEDYFILKEKNSKQNLRIISRIYSQRRKIPNDIIELEFKNIYDTFYKKYNVYPTCKQFNELSKYTDILYRKRFKTNSWNKIRMIYGYPPNYDNNITETVYLTNLSEILNEQIERQKTWEWLIGVKGYHLFCDGVFENIKLVTEFDGAHHRINIYGKHDLLTKQENDKLKDKLVKEHGYKMLRVSSKEHWQDTNYLIKRLEEIGIAV